MAVNHVVINGVEELNLRADTVAAATLAQGVTAHDRTGTQITGTMQGAKPEQAKSVTLNANGTSTVTPDSGKALSSVAVTVAIPTYDGTVD